MNKSSAITSQLEPASASAPEAYHEEDRGGSNLSIENKQALGVGEEDHLIGETLQGKYLIEEALAAGGMCTIYRARHVLMDKTVAVKVLHPQLAADQQIVERFQQEARAASRIDHPHAVSTIDFGMTPQGRPFMVMDLVRGDTLSEVMNRYGALSVNKAGLLLRQTCSALEAAHAVGVVHRDIKPDNIIVSECDGQDWVTVVDFGVAKIQEDLNKKASLASITGGNWIVGTPRYMSPEQAEGRAIDARSDVYSLGVVLYEMLAGEAPFKDDSSTRLLIKHASEPPPPLREKRPDLPAEIEAVVMRALAKDPQQRPQSAAALSEAFDQATGIAEPAVGVDRASAFSRIMVPLVQDGTKSSNRSSFDEAINKPAQDEVTVIRPRARTEVLPLHSPVSYPVTTPEGERRNPIWPVAIIALLAFALAGGLGFFYFNRRPNGIPAGDFISSAQRAVIDARARIESLPKEHALYNDLAQLIQWEGELNGFAAAPQKTAEMRSRAQMIEQRANQFSAQARNALATLPRGASTPPAPPSASTGEEAKAQGQPRPQEKVTAPREAEDETGRDGARTADREGEKQEGAKAEKGKKDKGDLEQQLEELINDAQKKGEKGQRLPEALPTDPTKVIKPQPTQEDQKKAEENKKKPEPKKLP